VWLEHTTGHYGVANSAALAIAGITAGTPDPAAGTIERDQGKHPTGVLKEAAQNLVAQHIPEATPDDRRTAILNTIAQMNSEGMTGFKEPGITATDWAAYESLARAGQLRAHACILRGWRDDPASPAAAEFAQALLKMPRAPRTTAPNLSLCGIKVFMDGSGGARTAWMYDDWHRNSVDLDAGNHGYPSIDPQRFRAAVRVFHAAGLHVSTHAIGDQAIDWVVDTYAEVLREHPTRGLRHGIIHANTPTDHALDVMATLQHDFDAGFPETQAEFTWWIGDNYAGNLGPARAARLNPYQSYVRRGIRFGGGSDFPVTPLPARYGLWSSVARRTLRGTYGAQPFGTAESIGVDDALSSYTTWAAHQMFLDDEAGSLEPGKSADVAVWDRDLVNVPTDSLKTMKCELTLFRGAIVYRAPGTEISTSTLPSHR
jgi:predicted amidohydrolase YtcJ